MTKKPVDPSIELLLQELDPVPPRDSGCVSLGRARFLTQAAEYRQSVSKTVEARQKWWIFHTRKENYAMNILATLLLATALLFGGGATIAAAQDDLPGQSLYPVKTLVEDIRLDLNGDSQKEVEMLMVMAEARVMEMISLNNSGITPPVHVAQRLELHIQQALMIAANLEAGEQQQALLRIHSTLQTQTRLMNQIHSPTDDPAALLMTQVREMLHVRLRLVDEGLADPQGFQQVIQNEYQQQNMGESSKPGQESGDDAQAPGNGEGGPNPQGTQLPGNGPGSNQDTQGPYSNDNQSGPGAGTQSGGSQPTENGNHHAPNSDPGSTGKEKGQNNYQNP